ncbi:hypothetical protein P8843_07025 [Bacillus inaquosorum]|uniref:hypothetical protein n=1 Tax=Bacillus inaquosorum TaxID=483913 RepID=UPI00228082E9|nr:hypothetical protein [Bacillus inaquosorum]MCY7977454.1 hypothetical protein [Bacillus inaquosorum]MEC0589981.1 hypothetical protein [Bacillus inaquosorum]
MAAYTKIVSKNLLFFDAVRVPGDACNLNFQHKGKYSPFASCSLESTVWVNPKYLTQLKKFSHSELMTLIRKFK